MKKGLFFWLLSLLFFACEPQEVFLDSSISPEITTRLTKENKDISKDEALQVATKFTKQRIKTKSAPTPIPIVDKITTVTGQDGSPALYIINYGEAEGFVIVSATKKYQPILAYAQSGRFNPNDTQPGLHSWLEEQKAAIAYQKGETPTSLSTFQQMWTEYEETPATTLLSASDNALKAPSPILALTHRMEEEWRNAGYACYRLKEASSIMSSSIYTTFCSLAEANANKAYDYMEYAYILEKGTQTFTKVDTLLTTLWNQHPPYNELVKTIDGKKAPAGCVAIALAQIMRYHEWPSTYDWKSMSDITANLQTQALIRDIGTAVNMKYGSDGSESNIDNALKALHSTFGYSGNKIDHDVDKVTRELKAHRPVYMRADTKKFLFITWDGHAWVCDGLDERIIYKEFYLQVISPSAPLQYKQIGTGPISEGFTQSYYHMNWGWDYQNHSNGWYGDANTYIPSMGIDLKYQRQDIINIIPNK